MSGKATKARLSSRGQTHLSSLRQARSVWRSPCSPTSPSSCASSKRTQCVSDFPGSLSRRGDTDSLLPPKGFFSVTTIVFLSVHMAVNGVALTVFGVEHAQPDGFVLSTAFWLTAASSCVALAAVVCLFVDGLATGWYVRGGTGISSKQRSLVITFDFFVALLLVGSVVYHFLLPNVTFLDTVYLCIQSVLTVGFGGTPIPLLAVEASRR